MKTPTHDLIQHVKTQDPRALAKLLSAVERAGPACFGHFPELLAPPRAAFRIGLTGPPGAGKSTLIGKFIAAFRQLGLRVGVMAVDPSSPFTQGAVLGDRIRYTEHFNDPGVFIRSLGSRGSLGGLSSSAYLMVRAFDLAEFDIVLLETVGVGQTELEIMNVADQVVVVLVPESGDSIQGMKAGLLEIADLFLVNKGDRPGSDAFKHELEASLLLDPRAPTDAPKVLKVSALTGDGFPEVLEILEERRARPYWPAARLTPSRLQAEAKALLRVQIEREIELRSQHVRDLATFAQAFQADTAK